MSRIKELLQVSEQQKSEVRSLYEKSEDSIKQDLDILHVWLKKQAHLPNIDDNVSNNTRLESLLLRNKFRIENTKLKIDKYFSLRGIHPNFFNIYDVDSEPMLTFKKCLIWIPMPKLTENNERILVCKIINPDPELYDIQALASIILMMVDISMSHDYAVGDRIINDFAGFTTGHFKKFNPSLLGNLLKLHQEAFSTRLLGFEFLNAPAFVDLLMQFFRPIFKEKIYKRITIHDDLESLYKVVPKKYLPKDYGGEERSLKELNEEWMEEVKVQREFLEENAKLVSDETLRVGKLEESELFGSDGTFKKLNLD